MAKLCNTHVTLNFHYVFVIRTLTIELNLRTMCVVNWLLSKVLIWSILLKTFSKTLERQEKSATTATRLSSSWDTTLCCSACCSALKRRSSHRSQKLNATSFSISSTVISTTIHFSITTKTNSHSWGAKLLILLLYPSSYITPSLLDKQVLGGGKKCVYSFFRHYSDST